MNHFIYKTTCNVTGHYYIGLHSTENVDDGYLGSGVWLKRSVKKYGRHAHIREIIEMLPDRETLALREETLVNEETLGDPLCMNLIKGGSKGFGDRLKRASSPEFEQKRREALSKALRGRKMTEEHKIKLKIARNNRKISEQQKERVRMAHLGKAKSDAHCASMIDSHKKRNKEAWKSSISEGVKNAWKRRKANDVGSRSLGNVPSRE